MRAGRKLLALTVLGPLFASGAESAAADLFDQSNLSLSGARIISSYAIANDVDVPSFSRLDTLTVWLAEVGGSDNGVFEGFSGSIGWGIYLDDSGPDTLLYSGTDLAPEVIDSGLTYGATADVFKVRIHLDGRPQVVGDVWIALREGPWGTVGDGSEILWVNSDFIVGSTSVASANEASPGSWFSDTISDPALVAEVDPIHWIQVPGVPSPGVDFSQISSRVSAGDFVVSTPTTLGSVDAWLADGFSSPTSGFDNFGGTISWAIYSDLGGAPSVLIASGADSAPRVTDTGLSVDGGGRDLFQVRFLLAGRPTLAAGTYWLALHEGAWGSAYDGSDVQWFASSLLTGSAAVYAEDETAPASWQSRSYDLAFVLFEDELFASGFEAGVACAWSLATGGALCP